MRRLLPALFFFFSSFFLSVLFYFGVLMERCVPCKCRGPKNLFINIGTHKRTELHIHRERERERDMLGCMLSCVVVLYFMFYDFLLTWSFFSLMNKYIILYMFLHYTH